MSTTGPLHPEQPTREETLDEACVGPEADLISNKRNARHQILRWPVDSRALTLPSENQRQGGGGGGDASRRMQTAASLSFTASAIHSVGGAP
jgi:hypothetical protein